MTAGGAGSGARPRPLDPTGRRKKSVEESDRRHRIPTRRSIGGSLSRGERCERARLRSDP